MNYLPVSRQKLTHMFFPESRKVTIEFPNSAPNNKRGRKLFFSLCYRPQLPALGSIHVRWWLQVQRSAGMCLLIKPSLRQLRWMPWASFFTPWDSLHSAHLVQFPLAQISFNAKIPLPQFPPSGFLPTSFSITTLLIHSDFVWTWTTYPSSLLPCENRLTTFKCKTCLQMSQPIWKCQLE